ncbi:hypothetical protein EMCG_06291, partial [[Emmonsia] crescens]
VSLACPRICCWKLAELLGPEGPLYLAHKTFDLERSLRNVGPKMGFRMQIVCQRHWVPSPGQSVYSGK